MEPTPLDRRKFIQHTAAAGAALAAGSVPGVASVAGAEQKPRKIRVAVIGCGSVSRHYLPHLAKCPYAELVSTCDIIPERAQRQAKEFSVPNHYPHIAELLAGAEFDLLVNLTDMQEHERLNRQAIEAGKHVWSEKPMAGSLQAGRELLRLAGEKGVRIWAAPVVVTSPQFAFMARTLAAGKLGRIAAAHAVYGHTGPGWASFFYEEGGGSMPDLGVYSLTTLTGLLGPARSVTAMTSIVTPTRVIDGKGTIEVREEDNAMVVLDHGNGVLSHVQCGFNFFGPHGEKEDRRHNLSIVGSEGYMGLAGYDWRSGGVDLATKEKPAFERHATDAGGYEWEQGASVVAECLVTGKEPLFTVEHALHVVEIIAAARESSRSGRRVDLESTFKWPVIG